MTSNSLDSFANLIVEFDFSKDPRVASQEVRDKIAEIRNELPTEMEEPILTQFDPADRPIMSLTLSSPGLTGAELTRIADPDITRRIRAISGVASVNLAGAIERELVDASAGTSAAVRALARKLVAGSESPHQALERLHRYVADEVRYVGLEHGEEYPDAGRIQGRIVELGERLQEETPT